METTLKSVSKTFSVSNLRSWPKSGLPGVYRKEVEKVPNVSWNEMGWDGPGCVVSNYPGGEAGYKAVVGRATAFLQKAQALLPRWGTERVQGGREGR